MSRKVLLSLLTAFTITSSAQLNGDGYYRIQNVNSGRYISVTNNKVHVSGDGTIDFTSLQTFSPFSRIVSDPSTVIYFQNINGKYTLKAQGIDTYNLTEQLLTITLRNGTYTASATQSGLTKYLADALDDGNVGQVTDNNNKSRTWYILPVNDINGSYFGIEPSVYAGGRYHQTFYASFPFSFASSGMSAYYVSGVDHSLGIAIISEISGAVPASTPVIVSASSNQAAQNKFYIGTAAGTAPSNNQLTGVYFDRLDNINGIDNRVIINQNTMRLLGQTATGALGFVKSSLTSVPHNTAYLSVPAGSPDEYRIMTQAQYEEEKAKDNVTVTAKSYQRNYGSANPTFEYTVSGAGTLKGTPELTCDATPQSPVGTYPIVVKKGSVTNNVFNGVNGTLTVTKAPLTIKARSYTIKESDPLPDFAADYTGFVNGENENSLSTKPTFTANVPANKTPGTYTITVSGAASGNYDISYVAGQITITQVETITLKAANLVMEYGDEVPTLTYTVEGGQISGTPILHCSAIKESPVGTYPISIEKGDISYPRLNLVAGMLTVKPAPLTISTGTYTMKQTEARPAFAIQYEGFKNNETEAVLTKLPQISTNAPANNLPGEYELTISGAEANNYTISYVSGKLIIAEADEIIVIADDKSMTYGDTPPELTYSIIGGTVTGKPVLMCPVTSLSDAGTYSIIVDKGTLNYPNLKIVNGKFTVNKAPLTASVGNYRRAQGSENPIFVIEYDGFRNYDNENSLQQKATATTDATKWSPVGEYIITVAGGEAINYDFNYQNGRLTVYLPTNIVSHKLSEPTDVYSTSGKLILRQATNLDNLPKGIYIINGKKTIISGK